MHEHNLHTGRIQVQHHCGMYLWNKSNMLKSHSTQDKHEHNLQTGWIQVKHQHGIIETKIALRVCMSTTYQLVESKSNINMVFLKQK